MGCKQAQLFQFTKAMRCSAMDLCEKLSEFEYEECLPSMPYGAGWVSPVDEQGAPLAQSINGYMMICLQIEEKILPPIIVRQELLKKIKIIKETENRKRGQKEKYALKDEITTTLLPQAFSKLTKIYAYIDNKNHWLILGTAAETQQQQFDADFLTMTKMLGGLFKHLLNALAEQPVKKMEADNMISSVEKFGS